MTTAKGVSPPKVADDSSAESSGSSGADGDDAERGGVPERTSPADEEAEAPGARARSAEAAGALIEALLLRGAQVNETGRTPDCMQVLTTAPSLPTGERCGRDRAHRNPLGM